MFYRVNNPSFYINNSMFNDWIKEHPIGDAMIFKDNALNQIMTFDKIVDHMKVVAKKVNNKCNIVGYHMSKSIELPVLEITYGDTKITIRGNFYDYVISVISKKAINNLNDDSIFSQAKSARFFQGFPKESKVTYSYKSNHKTFSVKLDYDNCNLYLFMHMLFSKINEAHRKK